MIHDKHEAQASGKKIVLHVYCLIILYCNTTILLGIVHISNLKLVITQFIQSMSPKSPNLFEQLCVNQKEFSP